MTTSIRPVPASSAPGWHSASARTATQPPTGRALVPCEATPAGADAAQARRERDAPEARAAAPGLADARFVVQLMACRDGLNGYRRHRRADPDVARAAYGAMERSGR
jgi:hypothetical protein